MRLVKISAPEGNSENIAQIAYSVGIKQVSVQRSEVLRENETAEIREAVEIETSTPKAKRFVDALLAADFYNPQTFTVAIRQPRSIISRESFRELTEPLVIPAADILEELWQFSHITIGFVGRVLIAGCFLAFGLIHQQILIIIAGLLFLPLLPLLLAIGFGFQAKQLKLSAQGALAFAVTIILLILSGAVIAAVSSPPLKYDEFNSLGVSLLISAAVGIAAEFGKRG